ncbi:MAG TPA: hypothetical protein VGZ27_13910 [Vicinamibacterales bacterium]|jgi:uncharacterized membrane protein HdeD (DUF308 family)|nr:hypothetical protein [Vicinamibacterales bacterium]
MSIGEWLRGGVHLLEHAAAGFVGFALAVFGMALIFTAVFSVFGIVLLCVGVAVIVGAIWAHQLAGP